MLYGVVAFEQRRFLLVIDALRLRLRSLDDCSEALHVLSGNPLGSSSANFGGAKVPNGRKDHAVVL